MSIESEWMSMSSSFSSGLEDMPDEVLLLIMEKGRIGISTVLSVSHLNRSMRATVKRLASSAQFHLTMEADDTTSGGNCITDLRHARVLSVLALASDPSVVDSTIASQHTFRHLNASSLQYFEFQDDSRSEPLNRMARLAAWRPEHAKSVLSYVAREWNALDAALSDEYDIATYMFDSFRSAVVCGMASEADSLWKIVCTRISAESDNADSIVDVVKHMFAEVVRLYNHPRSIVLAAWVMVEMGITMCDETFIEPVFEYTDILNHIRTSRIPWYSTHIFSYRDVYDYLFSDIMVCKDTVDRIMRMCATTSQCVVTDRLSVIEEWWMCMEDEHEFIERDEWTNLHPVSYGFVNAIIRVDPSMLEMVFLAEKPSVTKPRARDSFLLSGACTIARNRNDLEGAHVLQELTRLKNIATFQ